MLTYEVITFHKHINDDFVTRQAIVSLKVFCESAIVAFGNGNLLQRKCKVHTAGKPSYCLQYFVKFNIQHLQSDFFLLLAINSLRRLYRTSRRIEFHSPPNSFLGNLPPRFLSSIPFVKTYTVVSNTEYLCNP